jgi:hypothetical protein
MKVTILQLLRDLVSYTNVNSDNTIYSTSKFFLGYCRDEFNRLDQSNDPEKQRKMINLFLGGTIRAMFEDEQRYAYKLGAVAIARKSWEHTRRSEETGKAKVIQDSYAIGNYIVNNLPAALSRDMYLQNRNTDPNPEIMPLFGPPPPAGRYFPLIADNIKKIDILFQFCIQYRDIDQGLEALEIDTDDLGFERDLSLDPKPSQTRTPTPTTEARVKANPQEKPIKQEIDPNSPGILESGSYKSKSSSHFFSSSPVDQESQSIDFDNPSLGMMII